MSKIHLPERLREATEVYIATGSGGKKRLAEEHYAFPIKNLDPELVSGKGEIEHHRPKVVASEKAKIVHEHAVSESSGPIAVFGSDVTLHINGQQLHQLSRRIPGMPGSSALKQILETGELIEQRDALDSILTEARIETEMLYCNGIFRPSWKIGFALCSPGSGIKQSTHTVTIIGEIAPFGRDIVTSYFEKQPIEALTMSSRLPLLTHIQQRGEPLYLHQKDGTRIPISVPEARLFIVGGVMPQYVIDSLANGTNIF